MDFSSLTWLLPAAPLAGFLTLTFAEKRLSKGIAGIVGSGAILLSFAIAVGLFLQVRSTGEAVHYTLFEWIKAGGLNIGFSFQIDQLSGIMLLIVTGIGFLIHVYSAGYMHDDAGFNRFFSYLNLFIFFMLLLVMGNNFVLLFVGWEGVGLCSYLLIGFWYKNHNYNAAANKAFIMNRIGDLGLLLGIVLIYMEFGTLNFQDIINSDHIATIPESTVTIITLLLLTGAVGKSAQIPLYTWLPDAMAGPTPVSALIHAATMVTAGIYLIIRNNVLFSLAPFTMDVIIVVSLTTSVLSATIGLKQNDIKKVLAYSTVSQLGLMFFALGIGAYSTALFHLTTHAFFKALLFLAAGSVIHALHHEQDITKMGGLRKKIPVTWAVFLIGTLAIAGIPPLSGMFSKDEILAAAYEHSPLLWFIVLAISILTTVYMFRLFFVTFAGKYRGNAHTYEHIHESPRSMTIPLIVLAILSALGGFINIPHFLGGHASLHEFLSPVVHTEASQLSHSLEWTLFIATVVIIVGVILTVRYFYVQKATVPTPTGKETGLGKVLARKYFVDEIYEWIIVKPILYLSKQLSALVETFIDGIVNGFGSLAVWSSQYIRTLQTGQTVVYLFVMVIGIAAAIIFNVLM